jgi:multidrug efflux system membrane fusion protein
MDERLKGRLAPLRRLGRPRLIMGAAAALLVLVFLAHGASESPAAAPVSAAPVPADTALAVRGDVPVRLDGLGTVQAFYTVTITPRVDGELQSLGFVEGQMVKPGDLLAKIDPRPFQAALDQAVAAKNKDSAQLANACRDLERYVTLAPQDFTSQQTLETQRALVAQLEAQVNGDQAVIDNARTQLDYTSIKSPIRGRTGIRMVDPGNNVHAAAGTGIVVVTQLQPISVIFTLPEEALLAVNAAMAAGPLTVTAMSRDGKTVLDRGVVGLVDNLIDQTTGTIRLKATFPNKENTLWPGEFVNARVLARTRRGVLTIPSAAVQHGPKGVFAYVVKADSTLEARPLEIAEEADNITVVEKGLREGERVTTSNQYRLQPGLRIQPVEAPPRAAAVAQQGESP